MSRPERVGQLLRQIEHETQTAFDEHTELLNLNNQLKAENAKLKQELEAVGTAAYLYGRTDLADENARLRRLVEYMTPIVLYSASERERDELRELGVEVNE